MSYIELSDREVEIIRHSLGWNRDRIAYRNYFAADRDSEDDATCLGLVKRGLAIGRETSVTPDRAYFVGLRAANAVRKKDEILAPEIAAILNQIDENIQKLHGDSKTLIERLRPSTYVDDPYAVMAEAANALEAKDKEIQELREALRPFILKGIVVCENSDWCDFRIRAELVRTARAKLEGSGV